MEEPSLEDSREDLFYTTHTDFFEYTPYEVEERASYSTFGRLVAQASNLSKETSKFILTSSAASLSLSFDFTKFLFTYINYLKLKAVGFSVGLEAGKDKIVRALMWRRGLLFRPATHGGVIILTALALVAGGLFSKSELAAQDLTLAEGTLTLQNSPETIIPTDRPRSEVIKYEVSKGDTLSVLSKEFGVSVESIRWANDLADEDSIKKGDILNIPPVSGVVHEVKKGQTIYSVAKKYKANPQAIADFPFNYIDQSLALEVGQVLMVPGGKKPAPVTVPTPGAPSPSSAPVNYAAVGSGLFSRPAAGPINQYASWYHPGIDIGADYGAAVFAAGSGKVITASHYGPGFGMHIFIDHGNGYVTAYAHLSGMNVNVGQKVNKGQRIGAVGCSGFCTGSHLHFEVRRGGARINPLSVL